MKLYLTGGFVRDLHLGLPPGKDLDFAVEAPSFGEMHRALMDRAGFRSYQIRHEFVCVRGSILRKGLGTFGTHLDAVKQRTRLDADFTLCREESMYHDKRHPSKVTPTNIYGDLKRRDFTINAIAVSEDGEVIDPYCGRLHAAEKMLRTVGDAHDRFSEDPLRILRGVRFAVTRELWIAGETKDAMIRHAPLLSTVKVDRVREELHKALAFNWRETMLLLMVDMPMLGYCIHENFPNLWLKATTEKR